MNKLQRYGIALPLWFAVALALAVLGWSALWAALGFVIWPLLEYSFHRWVQHGAEKHASARAYYVIHGAHHTYPVDPRHMLVPPAIVALVLLVVLLFGAALGALLPVVSVSAGLLLAYVLFEGLHYACHRWPKRVRFFATHHRRHHAFRERCFSVTCPWLDRLFGTE